MTLGQPETAEVIVLFTGNEITREMLYSEFEAILDGFVPVPDFRGQTAKAVYLVVNSNLCVTDAVFFLLDFDEKGMVDRGWNVPLQQLAEESGKGPDMGAGPIRLACYSQCAITWQRKNLWDPLMDPTQSSFHLIKRAVKNNHGGLIFNKSTKENLPPVKGLSSQDVQEQDDDHLRRQQELHAYYSNELRVQLSSLAKEQRLRIATIQSKHQETVHKLQQEHQQRVQAYQQKIRELEASKADLETRNETYKEMIDIHAAKVEGIREYYTHKLKMAQHGEGSQLQELHENFAVELDLKVQTATAELREMLEMREVELFYRHQNENALKEEIANIKREFQALLNSGGEHLVKRLAKTGVNFVVYHPGVGQFNIPHDDLSAYIDNPTAYIAKTAGVSETLYANWLEHYQNPVCSAVDVSGHLCQKRLSRIGVPLEFHEGESDRCEHHQMISYKIVVDNR